MTPRLRLYDRLRDEIVDVEPSTPGVLRVYSCGPTVYGRIHIGNARPYWTAMVLKRACEQLLGLPVRLAINITDVNDKIYAAAARQGVPVGASWREQMADGLSVRTPRRSGSGGPMSSRSRARRSPEIIDLIERLVERGAAYASDDGDVYFSVAAYPHYGELSGQRPDELIAGSRVEPGEGKRSPLDFALWKANEARRGHRLGLALGTRAARLAHRVLGDGARAARRGLRRARRRARPDLPAPRERARAVGGRGRALRARLDAQRDAAAERARRCRSRWATSTGLAEALERVGRETLLVFFAQAHYRSPVDYSDATLEQAAAAAAGLREALRNARRYAAAGGGR